LEIYQQSKKSYKPYRKRDLRRIECKVVILGGTTASAGEMSSNGKKRNFGHNNPIRKTITKNSEKKRLGEKRKGGH